jgi:hypothetical protein
VPWRIAPTVQPQSAGCGFALGTTTIIPPTRQEHRRVTGFRIASFVVLALGLGAGVAWPWWQFDVLQRQEAGQVGYHCGLSYLAIVSVAVLGVGLASLVAALLNLVAFRRSPKPRPTGRKVELVMLALPAVFVLLACAFLLF